MEHTLTNLLCCKFPIETACNLDITCNKCEYYKRIPDMSYDEADTWHQHLNNDNFGDLTLYRESLVQSLEIVKTKRKWQLI
jgi:hypothetical protein